MHALALGPTPHSVLEKFAAVQMIDVQLPTADGRELVRIRYTEPEPELKLLLKKLVRDGLAAGGRRIRTCMGLFLSSGHFWFAGGSLFGAGKPFFVPSPAIGFAERAEGVKGPKR